jgi:hypothetical protein
MRNGVGSTSSGFVRRNVNDLLGERSADIRKETFMAHGHFARLTALAIATGTLVAVSSAPAGAAIAPDARILGESKATALRITINLPAALAGTPLGSKIEQTVSLTDGSVSTISQPLATTAALLGKGTTPVLSDLLAQHTTAAALDGVREQTSAAVDINQAGVKVSVLPLVSKVADPTGDGVLAHSSSGVARISLGALPLPQVAAVTGGTSAATGTVTNTVNTAINTLNGATQNSTAPVTAPVQAAIDTAVGTLTETLSDLTGTIGLLTSATDLVTLDKVISEQTVSRKGAQVTSTASNSISNVNILNGLVKVDALESAATAIAGGTPGSADATFKPGILNLSLANGALTATLDEKGLNVGGTVGDALPQDLENTVNGAVNAVNDLLMKQLGVEVQLAKGTKSVSPDGTSAVASASAAKLIVNPAPIAALLPAGAKFMEIALVEADAAAASQIVPLAATPPTQVSFTGSLPRTGGELPLAVVAVTLIGGALVIRRRRVTA